MVGVTVVGMVVGLTVGMVGVTVVGMVGVTVVVGSGGDSWG